MSSILILCNTYYQLITAIQMRITIFKEKNVSVALSDHSRNADAIVDAIKKEGIFDACALVKTKKDISTDAVSSILKSIYQGLFRTQENEIFNKSYDEFIFNNLECITYSIYNTLLLHNPNIKCSRVEEGILSYDFIDKKIKKVRLVEKIRKIGRKNLISENTNDFYCFYPELYEGWLHAISIPRIKPGGKIAHILSAIFKIDTATEYREKYIYFTSVYDFEGGTPIGESKIVEDFAKVVGKENLLIKLHPRDTRGYYENEGFKVDKNSSIPWEAIQLSHDFSDKVLMSTTSGSVLAGSFLSEKPIKTVYMHKFCSPGNNTLAHGSINAINNLLQNPSMKDVLKEVYVPEKYEEILNL